MNNLETIDLSTLSTVTGGEQAPAAPRPQRTWGQTALEYGGACLQGAGQALVTGRPRSLADGARRAAVGCALGVGSRALEDLRRT